MSMPNDPVLRFICDNVTRELIKKDQDSWHYSRLTSSRLEKIGYRLIVLRCAQIGIEPPTRIEASEWARSV